MINYVLLVNLRMLRLWRVVEISTADICTRADADAVCSIILRDVGRGGRERI